MCPNEHCFHQNSPFGKINSCFNSASIDHAISATGTVYESTRKQPHGRITCHFSQSKPTLCSLNIHQTLTALLGRQKITGLKLGSNSVRWEGQLQSSHLMAVPSVLTAQSSHSSTMPDPSRVLLHHHCVICLSGFITQFRLVMLFRPRYLRSVFLPLSLHFSYIVIHRNALCTLPISATNQQPN